MERRSFLIGAAAIAAALPAHAAEMRVTPHNELGPFYRRGAPHDANLIQSGDAGLPLEIEGIVYRTTGEAIQDARIELWHTDNAGHYDVTGARFRADLRADGKGGYRVQTITPGHYPDRVCQHVHFLVRADGCKPLVTQLYFATDPIFEGDPDRNFGRDPLIQSRELVRPVVLLSRGAATIAKTTFDLVLEKL